jgi:hypothetical protein
LGSYWLSVVDIYQHFREHVTSIFRVQEGLSHPEDGGRRFTGKLIVIYQATWHHTQEDSNLHSHTAPEPHTSQNTLP